VLICGWFLSVCGTFWLCACGVSVCFECVVCCMCVVCGVCVLLCGCFYVCVFLRN